MNEAEQRAILEAAAADPALVAEVPPVVALGFGVLALRRLGEVLTVACAAQAARPALRMLRAVLGRELVATPFEGRVLREVIRATYSPGGGQVNFPTFQEREFLLKEANAALLRREKVEDLGPVGCDLPAERVVLANLRFRTALVNLDHPSPGPALPDPQGLQVQVQGLEQVWRPWEGGFAAWTALGPRARVLVNEVRSSEVRHQGGRRHEKQEASGFAIETFPHQLHPTEVQLTGVEPDGALRVHVYDRAERFAPGAPRSVRLVYQFLSWGERLERTIDLHLDVVRVLERAALALRSGPMPWGAHELARWLGVEAPAGGHARVSGGG